MIPAPSDRSPWVAPPTGAAGGPGRTDHSDPHRQARATPGTRESEANRDDGSPDDSEPFSRLPWRHHRQQASDIQDRAHGDVPSRPAADASAWEGSGGGFEGDNDVLREDGEVRDHAEL